MGKNYCPQVLLGEHKIHCQRIIDKSKYLHDDLEICFGNSNESEKESPNEPDEKA